MTDMLAPSNEAGIVTIVAEACAAREPLLVLGNGTKSGMLRPVQAARSLSTRGHAGITLYSPNELVISACAGTPLADIEATLAERGQHIIAEPPDFSSVLGTVSPPRPATQTLGGVVATNLSGPRRVAWGAMRDHVLGVRAVTGRGEVIHSGGRVLKNVTGLDLCKLLAGSHGTLGVITEVTLKVLPAPEAVGTVALPGLDAAAGVAALSAALGSPFGVSAAAWLPAEAAARVPALAGLGRSVALARIEDFAASVAYRTEKLRSLTGPHGGRAVGRRELARGVAGGARSRAVGRRKRRGDLARLGAALRQAPRSCDAVIQACGAHGFLDWGGGLVWIAGPPPRRRTPRSRRPHGPPAAPGP